MPRNSSGTYTLPAGNPVVSGTLIEASWANTTLSDLASAMTDSLSRDGEGGMTAALRLYDGTVSVPGLAFSNETSTGLYRAGAGDMRLAVTGSEVVQFLNTGVAVTGTLSASGAVTLSSTLAVTGASTFTGAATFNATTTTFENATAYYPQLINRNKTNDANGSYISLQKIRSTSIVQNGDVLGNLIFSGYDGAAYLQGAYINAVVSATPGTNDMPADLAFGTTPDGSAGPSERLRITQAGNVGIGTSSPNRKLEVNGDLQSTNGSSNYSSLFFGVYGTPADSYTYIRGDARSTGFMSYYTNAIERMRIDSSGNVGIGTSSPSQKLDVAGNANLSTTSYLTWNGSTSYAIQGVGGAGGYIRAITGGNEAMRIDSSGNLLVGTTSTLGAKFALYGTSGGTNSNIQITNPGYGTGCIGVQGTSSNFKIYNCYSSGTLGTGAGIDIDTSGNLLVGTTSSAETSSPGLKLINSLTDASCKIVSNTAVGGNASFISYNTNATNNGYRFYTKTDGGIANYSANNVNLSDARTKTDIQDAGGYLAKICAIPVRTFKYKDQADDLLNLGVIAQEVETIAPELVDVSGFGETPEDGVPLKAIYQTDLQYALMKCIQEQQALITTLTERLSALEATP